MFMAQLAGLLPCGVGAEVEAPQAVDAICVYSWSKLGHGAHEKEQHDRSCSCMMQQTQQLMLHRPSASPVTVPTQNYVYELNSLPSMHTVVHAFDVKRA